MNTADGEELKLDVGSHTPIWALKEELDMQGPLRMAEVEAAQDGILDTVRKLEAGGEIILDDGEEEYV